MKLFTTAANLILVVDMAKLSHAGNVYTTAKLKEIPCPDVSHNFVDNGISVNSLYVL